MTPEPEAGGWRWHSCAFILYAGIAFITFDHGADVTDHVLGGGSDSFIFIWFLKWWPWCLKQGLAPLHTNLVWQPAGIATLWVTSVPLLALLMAPVTLLGGPVLAYNLLAIAAPSLSAWCAYRLCLTLCGDFQAALIGGFLYGFSAYEVDIAYATINQSFSCVIPLLAWAAVQRFRGAIGQTRFVIVLALLLVAEFLVSLEISATLVVFSILAWCLAYVIVPEWRLRLWRLLSDTLPAAPLVLLALSPIAIFLFQSRHFLQVPWYWTFRFSEDLAGLINPTPLQVLQRLIDRFAGTALSQPIPNQTGEISLLELVIVACYAREMGRSPPARFGLVTLAVVIIASLGPQLWVNNKITNIILPWWIFTKIPLLGAALPRRFAVYAALLIAVIVGFWVATPPAGLRRRRHYFGLLACLLMLPGFKPMVPVPASPFFAPGRLQSVLGPHPAVLILPFAINGPASYWQMENDFGFSQTGGYLGPPPAAMIGDPAVVQLYDNVTTPDLPSQFQNFCESTHTAFVIAGPGTPAALSAILAGLRWPAKQYDDVTVYTVPAAPKEQHGG